MHQSRLRDEKEVRLPGQKAFHLESDPAMGGSGLAMILWNAAALAASLAHVLIDYHIGLFGESSPTMSPLQAVIILILCLVYGCWSISLGLATSGYRAGLLGSFAFTVVWAFLASGLVGLAACLPPCQNAFPYQDIAHVSSLVFGVLAAYTTWQKIRAVSPVRMP